MEFVSIVDNWSADTYQYIGMRQRKILRRNWHIIKRPSWGTATWFG